jgi:DNA-3-methyladenine glycosylase II
MYPQSGLKQMNPLHNINDPVLHKVMAEVDIPVIASTRDVFHDVMSCIIEQQIHYRSTKKTFQKALERAGIGHLSMERFHLLEEHAFPHMKLSEGKYATMMAFMDHWSTRTVDLHALPDQEVVAVLSSIPGIGRWTIDMVLLYTLQRPDIFPADDFHLKQVMTSLYGLDPSSRLRSQMLEVASRWGGQRSLAVLYLLEWKRSRTQGPRG